MLEDGKVLMMPDNWNDVSTSRLVPGYDRENHVLYYKKKEYKYVAQVHTHGKGADKGLSATDERFAAYDPGISVFILHGDGYIYGGYYSRVRKGIDNWENNDPIPLSLLKTKPYLLFNMAIFYKNK